MEILFDGKPEAAEDLAATAQNERARMAKARGTLATPADINASSRLARPYHNLNLVTFRYAARAPRPVRFR